MPSHLPNAIFLTLRLTRRVSLALFAMIACFLLSTGTGTALGQNLQVQASDPDGVNTGTARLGAWVNFSTTLTNSPIYGARGWILTGAGSLQSTGYDNGVATYTPPTVMPANRNVSVTVTLPGDSAIATTYSFTLINPVPTISTVAPNQLLSGGAQAVTIVGSGFVPGMVALLNGVAFPTTVTDMGHLSSTLQVPNTASGSLNLQLSGPTPGGGLSNVTQVTVPVNSIALTASNPDGTNTGSAELSTKVAMSAAVKGSAQTSVQWSVAGPGSISSGGVYTAPAVMPASRSVTITAKLASNSAIAASYALSVINPTPVIDSTSNLVIPAGATTMLSLSGNGFVPQTVVLVNGVAVSSTYGSAGSMTAAVTVPAGESGYMTLRAQNPSPGGGVGGEFEQSISAPISATAAARLLDQTTFGPTTSLIQHVQQEGTTAWLAEQFTTPPTPFPVIPAVYPSYCGDAEMCLESEWWSAALIGKDQLRQRVAFALSEMFVVSSNAVTGQGINSYATMLANDAFTNWYTIMSDVTVSPAMGIYLNMLNSYKATGTQIANENYARENMQLFNLGLSLLNADGTPKADANGNPIPTYTEAQVEAFARVYTGWTFANADGSSPSQFTGTANYYHPLVAVEQWHDSNPKTLLNGTVLPAGQTAEQDLAQALTNIFEHPNTGPFVCKQLIQHLVTSNPSPAYVSRVAAVFADNGNHVRGDMTSVLTAIFTDPEARAGDTAPQVNDGHLREPVLWMTAVMRALGYVNIDPNNYYQYLSFYSSPLGEVEYQSPAVFNFFPPSYVVPGTQLSAPEFALENTASVTDRLTLADMLMTNWITGFHVDLSATSPLGLVAGRAVNLVNALDVLFTHSQMDAATKTAIANTLYPITDLSQRVRVATYLVITSSEYKILH